MAPLDIPDISGYQLGIAGQFVKAIQNSIYFLNSLKKAEKSTYEKFYDPQNPVPYSETDSNIQNSKDFKDS